MPGSATSRRRLRPLLLLGLAVVPAAAAGATLGYGLKFDLPDVKKLEDYTPPLSTRVFAQDGTSLASFGEQRRTLVPYRDIPKVFEQALIAVEDSNFYHHSGVDLRGILRAAWYDVRNLTLEQGASTLTQQLARNLFPDVLKPEKTAHRKFQEMLLAFEIERRYTKQEILRLYCNQVYMGHGRYGIEAASRFFFGKSAKEMDLPEAALLAGLVQRPEGLSPFRHPERALKRRNHVLERMAEEGYLRPAAARAAEREPLRLSALRESANLAPYFVEEVRRLLQSKYGDESLYQSGLEVRTTLDPRLQGLANAAMDVGLRELDKRQGWRGVKVRVPPGESPDAWDPPSWRDGVQPGEVADAVVVSVSEAHARVRAGPYRGTLGPEEIAWTGRTYASSLLKRGDVIRVRIEPGGLDGAPTFLLEQEPRVEAALVAIDPATGAVRALLGGFDYRRSEFDRAIQARRQCGSAFKPFVYAAALTQGMTPAETILDEPTVFIDPQTFVPYEPENYYDRYYGNLTLRHALENSVNIATVKLLGRVGFAPVIDIARRLGISTELKPYPSLALGAFEVSLLELTSAYGAFADQGVRVEPHLVEEVRSNDGAALERAKPEVRDAVSPQIAYLMNRLLEGVVTDGTGEAAAELGRPLAGKTGTTNDFTDAWFIGYAPDLVVGVWVGFDEKKSLGNRVTGAQAALPIWKQFMETAYEGRAAEDFPIPTGVTIASIDSTTGLKASDAAGCAPVISEAFLAGTEPTAYCSEAEHLRLKLPYPFQRYPLDEDGALAVPSADLDRLLSSEPTVRLTIGGRRLEAVTPDGKVSLPIRRVPGRVADPIPEEARGKVDPAGWIGKDGRRATAVMIRR
ncbi:MAG: PBP1A family penicillin-binding protein [Acidobacteriia bacterium]|nr:PBP1A family penicillin-binding protein [Terriglobia bacterium]